MTSLNLDETKEQIESQISNLQSQLYQMEDSIADLEETLESRQAQKRRAEKKLQELNGRLDQLSTIKQQLDSMDEEDVLEFRDDLLGVETKNEEENDDKHNDESNYPVSSGGNGKISDDSDETDDLPSEGRGNQEEHELSGVSK